MKNFKKIFFCIVFTLTVLVSLNLRATVCTTTAPGVWSCGTPGASDTLIVNHNVTISGNFFSSGVITVANGTLTITGDLTINNSAKLDVNAGAKLQIGDDMSFRDNSITNIAGVLDVGQDMRLFDNAIVNVLNPGMVYVGKDMRVGSGGGSAYLNIESGATMDVAGDFRIDEGQTVNLDGTLQVVGPFRNDGDLCGIGTVTYGDGCSGQGQVCGNSEWCDDSGSIAMGGAPLPVELKFFKAKAERRKVKLNWQTASETNNDFFTVERMNREQRFITVGTVYGAGNSKIPANYEHTDAKPDSGINYYRLSQTDINGKKSYYRIVAVNVGREVKKLIVYPNPCSNGQVFLNRVSDIKILNMSGQTVIEKQNVKSVRLYGLKRGAYIVRDQNGQCCKLLVR